MQDNNLIKELEKAKSYLIIVEGKKDARSLKELGFKKIFIINGTGKSLKEKIEDIETLSSKNKICILTDFDKEGRQLYLKLLRELSTRNVKLDNKLRTILKSKISHVEGLSSYMKQEYIF